jgi:cysteine synthase
MAIDGVQSVQTRIAEIQRMLTVASGAAPVSTLGSPTGGVSFADTLASVSGATALVPAERRAPGAYGRLEPPSQLRQWGNGQIPPEMLVPIADGSERLYAPAAQAFEQMRSDAARSGVPLGVSDGYRSYEDQVAMARAKGLYQDGGLAAVPGTSNHGWGLALDLDLDARGTAWMRENGWRYGFAEDTPREPWHWTYRPAGGLR